MTATATALTQLRTYWPAYADVADAVCNAIIADCAVELGAHAPSVWRVQYTRALAALTAHHLEVRARSAAAAGAPGQGGTGGTATGGLNNLTTGSLSVGYSDGAARVAGGDQGGVAAVGWGE